MVERVPAEVTYELRHRVLGRGASPADVAAVDDDDPDSGHVARVAAVDLAEGVGPRVHEAAQRLWVR